MFKGSSKTCYQNVDWTTWRRKLTQIGWQWRRDPGQATGGPTPLPTLVKWSFILKHIYWNEKVLLFTSSFSEPHKWARVTKLCSCEPPPPLSPGSTQSTSGHRSIHFFFHFIVLTVNWILFQFYAGINCKSKIYISSDGLSYYFAS